MSANASAPAYHWYGLLFIGMVFFGSATPVSKIAGEAVPVLVAAGARLLIAGIVLLPFALWRADNLLRGLKHNIWIILGVALVGNVGFTVFLIYGMQMINGVMGSIIMSLTPAVTALGAVIFLHESMTRRKIFALLLGVAGVLIMHLFSQGKGGSSEHLILGSLLVFAAICCEASYSLMGKKATESLTPISLTCLAALIAGIAMLPAVFWQWPQVNIAAIHIKEWIALGWWAIGTLAAGSLFWYAGIAKVPGHIAAAFMVVMPLSALVLSYLLLNEPFKWIHLPGFGLALAGVLLMVKEHQQETKHEGS